MSLRKYAEVQVLEAWTGAGARQGTLERVAHRAVFNYTPREGYIYVRSRAISSRCNDNFDEFPAEEIKKAYATFIGKPVFVNHHNSDHRRARGVIIDAALHEDINPDGTPDTWAEVLMEVDAVRFPRLAAEVLAGNIARTSMGTDVAYSVCTACGNKASTPADYCQHIPRLKGMKIQRTTASGEKKDIIIAERCYGLGFFENSLLVEDPADPTAYVLGVEGMSKAASKTAGDGSMWFLKERFRDGTVNMTDDWERYHWTDENEALSALQRFREYDEENGLGWPDRWSLIRVSPRTAASEAPGDGYCEALVNHGQAHCPCNDFDDAGFSSGDMWRMCACGHTMASHRGGAEIVAAATHHASLEAAAALVREAFDHATDGSPYDQKVGPTRTKGPREKSPSTRDPDRATIFDYERETAWKSEEHDEREQRARARQNHDDVLMKRLDEQRAQREQRMRDIDDSDTKWRAKNPDYHRSSEPLGWKFPKVEHPKPLTHAASLVAEALRVEAAVQCKVCFDGALRCPGGDHPYGDCLQPEGPCPACGLTSLEWDAKRAKERVPWGTDSTCTTCGHAISMTHDGWRHSAGDHPGGSIWVPGYEHSYSIFEQRDDDHTPTPAWKAASRHLAYGETKAPAKVDTMRAENCPVCGDDEAYNGEKCSVCGYVPPPDKFADPDLGKAKEMDLRQEQAGEDGDDLAVDPAVGEGEIEGEPGAEDSGDLECTNCGEVFSAEGESAADTDSGEADADDQPGEAEEHREPAPDDEQKATDDNLADVNDMDEDEQDLGEEDDESDESEQVEDASVDDTAGDDIRPNMTCPVCGMGTLVPVEPQPAGGPDTVEVGNTDPTTVGRT
jgi:hypothetical protein